MKKTSLFSLSFSLSFNGYCLTVIVYCLSLFSIPCLGQSFLDRIDLGIDKFKASKLDTNYIALPDYKLMISVASKNFWSHDNIHIPFSWPEQFVNDYPGLDNYQTEKILSHTDQSSINFRVSYKGLAASYGFAVSGSGHRRSFSLGGNGNKYGFKLGFERNSLSNARFRDYRYLPVIYEFLNLFYEMGAIDHQYTIDEIADKSYFKREDLVDDLDENGMGENTQWELEDIVRWYGNFYYAFNHRKFSMSAANYADYIQKRSAGSFFLTGDVNYNRMHANNMFEVSEDTTYREHFSSLGIALGAGYGYNWTPNHGRLLLHGSLRPMVNMYSRMDYDAYYYTTDADGKKVKGKCERMDELAPLYDHKMKLTLGGVARVAAVWNITPRFVAGANAEYTIRDSSNKSDYRMYNSRFNLNAYFAMRFFKN